MTITEAKKLKTGDKIIVQGDIVEFVGGGEKDGDLVVDYKAKDGSTHWEYLEFVKKFW